MFISDKFIFDGISSTNYNMCIVSFDKEIISNMKIPFKTSVSRQTSNKHTPFYKEDYDTPEEITLIFAYMDDKGVLLPFTDETFIRLKKWLITDYFAPFVIEEYPNYKFYLKCVKIQDKLSYQNTGFLEVTFQPYTHYAYKNFEATIMSNVENVVDVLNESRDTYYPILIITNTGNQRGVIKVNEFEIEMDSNEKIIVDNAFLTVFNENGENKLKDCNRKWVSLNSGNNTIRIVGNAKVEIKAEFPVIL